MTLLSNFSTFVDGFLCGLLLTGIAAFIVIGWLARNS